MNLHKFLAPDDDVSSTGATAPEPAAAEPAAPVEVAPAAAAATPDPDWRSAFQSLYNNVEQQSKAQQAHNENIQKFLLQTFAPDKFKEMQAPQYATRQELQQMIAQQAQQQREFVTGQTIVNQWKNELATAKEKYPDLFSQPWAEAAVKDSWMSTDSEKAGKSVPQIAKEFSEAMDKAFLARQAKQMAGKGAVAEQVKGTPTQSGKVPAGGGGGNGAKGLAGIRERIMGAVTGGND